MGVYEEIEELPQAARRLVRADGTLFPTLSISDFRDKVDFGYR